MPISWVNSDGKVGVSEDAYMYAADRQGRGSDMEGPYKPGLPSDINEQNMFPKYHGETVIPPDDPNVSWEENMRAYSKGVDDFAVEKGMKPDDTFTVKQPDRDVLYKYLGPDSKIHGGEFNFMEVKPPAPSDKVSGTGFHEQLAAFQERLNNTPPAEANALQKFLGSLNIMPAPGKPQEEWTTKEHLGYMLNTAMAGMGGGYRMPKITGPGFGARPPADFNYPTDFKDYYPANNANRKGGVTFRDGIIEKQKSLEAMSDQEFKAYMASREQDFIDNGGPAKTKPNLKVIEGGLTTETIPQLQQAQDKRSWPEGWGETKATGRALTEYPHVQKAFKEAVESGAGSISEITDHMNLNGVTINPSTVQLLRKKAGLTGTKAEPWSEEKHNTFMNLIKEGKTTPEISEEMGLTRSTIEAKIRRIKEDDPTFERNFAERDTMSTRLAQVRELADQGLHANAIADKIGKSGAYVRMLASTGDISLPRDPKSLGGGARKKAEKGEWQKALQDRLNK